MKPTSESLSSEEMRYFRVVEDNCVPARVGGEQSETNNRPQTHVNLIRPDALTSQRRKAIGARAWVSGEVRVKRLTDSGVVRSVSLISHSPSYPPSLHDRYSLRRYYEGSDYWHPSLTEASSPDLTHEAFQPSSPQTPDAFWQSLLDAACKGC